jgi:hypothetical protein
MFWDGPQALSGITRLFLSPLLIVSCAGGGGGAGVSRKTLDHAGTAFVLASRTPGPPNLALTGRPSRVLSKSALI